MTLTVLDLMAIAHFGFNTNFPTWMWILAIINEIGFSYSFNKIQKGISK